MNENILIGQENPGLISNLFFDCFKPQTIESRKISREDAISSTPNMKETRGNNPAELKTGPNTTIANKSGESCAGSPDIFKILGIDRIEGCMYERKRSNQVCQ